jgi:transposase
LGGAALRIEVSVLKDDCIDVREERHHVRIFDRGFPSGRPLASSLGLTPREASSGLRRRLGAIRKRGDPYLRRLLLHRARSVLLHAKKATASRDRLRTWALDRERARGHNKAAVALANKLARIAWAVWRREQAFDVSPKQGAL